jgi:hypothetical protein
MMAMSVLDRFRSCFLPIGATLLLAGMTAGSVKA